MFAQRIMITLGCLIARIPRVETTSVPHVTYSDVHRVALTIHDNLTLETIGMMVRHINIIFSEQALSALIVFFQAHNATVHVYNPPLPASERVNYLTCEKELQEKCRFMFQQTAWWQVAGGSYELSYCKNAMNITEVERFMKEQMDEWAYTSSGEIINVFAIFITVFTLIACGSILLSCCFSLLSCLSNKLQEGYYTFRIAFFGAGFQDLDESEQNAARVRVFSHHLPPELREVIHGYLEQPTGQPNHQNDSTFSAML